MKAQWYSIKGYLYTVNEQIDANLLHCCQRDCGQTTKVELRWDTISTSYRMIYETTLNEYETSFQRLNLIQIKLGATYLCVGAPGILIQGRINS